MCVVVKSMKISIQTLFWENVYPVIPQWCLHNSSPLMSTPSVCREPAELRRYDPSPASHPWPWPVLYRQRYSRWKLHPTSVRGELPVHFLPSDGVADGAAISLQLRRLWSKSSRKAGTKMKNVPNLMGNQQQQELSVLQEDPEKLPAAHFLGVRKSQDTKC